ncbi:LysR family transcriptional regulator [Streptomyces ipomoeae]|uniref:LysR substrate binding domain protein n=1 Tax=Streptomyces ipomoeae 91-03 TaxID=698759 RepID=L1KUV2_9ACTN|nr:LysR family transcriptional regulator [Streptomyces ipomoeae]EKX64407.1 LysR substrate binding domain protein [Streptomyces ipomoeae 91-03]MDX2699692.1 LysR family transcriptional regulator [Streptomyces ipomoeae]MDX2845708.1 LysR family transcriptional regulator [Streptomyces ipomoeae]
MELRWLTSFVAVAEDLHFGHAADRLYLAPSALSAQIKALETELGVRLVDRGRRSRIRLTGAGELFLTEARLTLAQAAKAEAVGRRAGRGELGEVEIAYVASAAFSGVLTRVLADCGRHERDVTVRVREMETPAQLEALDSGRIDVGFLRWRPEYPADLTAVCLLVEDMLLALPEDHRLAALDSVPADELAEERFVVPHFDEEHDFRDQINEVAEAGGFTPRLAPPVRDFVAALTLVGGGLGVALVPDSVRCVHMPGVVHRPLADVSLTTRLVGVHRGEETSPAVRRVIQRLRAAGADVG